MTEAPEYIYLQWHGDSDPEERDSKPGGVTWSEDRVHPDDVRYVRCDNRSQDEKGERNRKRLTKQDLLDIMRRANDWINRDAVPFVSGNPPSADHTVMMVSEILDWRHSMHAVLDGTFDDAQHCTCVPYLRRRIETLEDAIRGPNPLPGWDGPDTLEMAAQRVEIGSATMAQQLRNLAQMQREVLQKGESDERT